MAPDQLENSLAEDKQELLALLLAEQGFDATSQPRETIKRIGACLCLRFRLPRSDCGCCTSGAAKYGLQSDQRIPRAWSSRLSGTAKRAGRIIERHEILRTTFHDEFDGPVQVIHPTIPTAFAVESLGDLAGAQREEAISRLLRDELDRPFDLERGPALRVRALRLGVAESLLLISAHHLVYDGFSIGVFVRELAELYKAGLECGPHSLSPPRLQYADFAQWQNRQDYRSHLEYWKRQLSGLPKLALPTDRPHPVVQSFDGAVQAVAIGPELTDRLRRIAEQHGTTLFITLLTAFQAFLHRYSDQDDFGVGVGVANRGRSEIEELIGFFVNTLVVAPTLAATLLSGNCWPARGQRLPKDSCTKMPRLTRWWKPFSPIETKATCPYCR